MKFSAPAIVGIVNITEDSFSDGGRYLQPDRALEHALALSEQGADVIELGAVSSNPDAKPVLPAVEIERLEPILEKLAQRGIAISVDAFQAETQRYCARRPEIGFINDIQGFPDQATYPDLAASSCKLVVMHSVQGRARPSKSPAESAAVIAGIYQFFERCLEAFDSARIARGRVILDPGMGYFLASNPEPSLAALREIPKLKERFNLPVMISVSRKSFLGALAGRGVGERGPATLAAELFAAMRGADYIRTHDVAALRDGLKIFEALFRGPE